MVKAKDKIILPRGDSIKALDFIPTGILSIDMTTGGWPRGRVVELYGTPGSGKSTLATIGIGEAQRMGLACFYFDLECTWDNKYVKALGTDPEDVVVITPVSGEQVLNQIKYLLNNWPTMAKDNNLSEDMGIIVLDSVAALQSEAEQNSDFEDANVAVIGRLMSRAFREFTRLVANRNVCLIYINQLRSTISSGGFGGPSTIPTGGKATGYSASLRLDMRRVGQIKVKEKVVGHDIRIMIKKNKVNGAEDIPIVVPMYHSYGFSKEDDLINLSLDRGLTKQAGAWYNYGDEKFQGKEQFKQWLLANPDNTRGLREAIIGAYNTEIEEE